MLQRYLLSILDLIYPNICVGCNSTALERPSIFCLSCASSLPYTGMEKHGDNDFEHHFNGRVHLEAGMALFFFTKGGIVQEAIYAMKYGNRPQVGYYLGRMLGYKIRKHQIISGCDAVVGVPLHKKKKWKRGYNQADYIAKGVSEVLEVPFYSDAIERKRMTSTQTRKTRLLRMKNMSGGFEVVKPELIQGKHILLVDDVLTSGATLDYCGETILNIDGSRLSMATIAMGSVV